ncbi:aspartate-semialdehyde dehydrogenase [Klebsiella pneumoniae]|nr:aspartate-semialdehyde dehydrogenase [Klebsiella pneumoniae]
MKQVGIVGWRGMVGSVLLQRMIEENDFDDITAHFFSTSSAGAPGPVINGRSDRLKDANSLSALAEMDIIITCQGGDYTKAIYPALINHGWQGYWIDAASALRMDERACIILDPVNRENIDRAVKAGIKLSVGGNCSITPEPDGVGRADKSDLIEWMSVMTHQSASGGGRQTGAGINRTKRLYRQHLSADELTLGSVLPLVNKVSELINSAGMPVETLASLMGSIIPWIDSDLGDETAAKNGRARRKLIKFLALRRVPSRSMVYAFVGVIRCHSGDYAET